MSWVRRILLAPVLIALVLVGGVTDRALVHQERMAQQSAVSSLDERARAAALSVRDALAKVEETVLAGQPMPAVAVGQRPVGARAGSHGKVLAYASRRVPELVPLLSSVELTASGLPEAVVASIALGDAATKGRVGDRLLSGLLPVSPHDLPYLAEALGMPADSRLAALIARLRRAPDPAVLPHRPAFRRTFNERGAIEAWSRTDTNLHVYEVAASALLDRAGVSDRADLAGGSAARTDHDRRVVPLPDVPGLALSVAPDMSEPFRMRKLRVVLWMAVATSLVGLAAMLRAVGREARAVAREKAFLASITHELRTPLAAIRVFGETLAAGRGDPPEYGALVAQESERLEALIEQVLSVTRIDEAPSFAPVKPADLVTSAMRLIAPRAALRSVHVDWEPANGLPDGWWDGDAVRRALLNLLDNAVKHGKRGGRVAVHTAVEGDVVLFSVADDGPGIGRRDRKRIFARFARGSSDTPGTGLGLYVVEQVARAHGGRVDLVTEENHGCTFTLALPLHARTTERPPVTGRETRE